MDSNALCDDCNKINFKGPGFYNHDGLPEGPIPALQRNIFWVKPRQFDAVERNLDQCIFCRKIAEIFSEWSLRQFGKQATPDLRKVNVVIRLFVLESPESLGEEDFLQHIQVRLSYYEFPKLFSTAVHFQKCSQHPPTVSELCNQESLFDWESGEEQAYSGRIRPLVVDQRLFCKWKETCCAVHGDPCNSIFAGRRPTGLRLIDVEKRCVVDSEDDSSYVALSYAWGGAKLPLLTKSTDECFRQAGSLDREMLLPTIDDAIEVTRILGEKFIWVDCLCIMQDDAADKHKFIPQMDSIFGSASVTIVAASGVDANAGLPGIKPGSRTREQIPFTIKGVSLLRTLDPEGSAAWDGGWPSYLGDTVWYSRGWTFQEKLFAGRALIFASEQVYWECQKATWREDGLWETTKTPPIYRWSFNEEEFRYPWASDVEGFEITYRKLVEEYSTRTLTYESDNLDAFAGILNALETQTGQTFLWALPASFLRSALTWPCAPFQGTPLTWRTTSKRDCIPKRRLEDCILRASDGTITHCPLPSWSWVGWVGEVNFYSNHCSLNLETGDLIFYIIDGSRSLVQASGCPQTHNEEVQVVPKERKSETHGIDLIPSPAFIWKESESRTIVTREDISKSILTRSMASNILFFWSSSAKLYLEHIGIGKDGLGEHVISSDKGKVVPGYWFHKPSFIQGHKELADFVVIGRDNFPFVGTDSEPFSPGLALLLVSWDSDGVAYRRGLVIMKTSDWVDLESRVWKLISLG